jgi:hypothetical protein
MNNELSRYVNQKNEIKKGESFCGSACVAMIAGQEPQDVADKIGSTADDAKLVDYLENEGWKCIKIDDGGNEKSKWAYEPTQKTFSSMKNALDSGKFILYHWAGWDGKSTGHYSVCTGYEKKEFIFSDPAGDRNAGYFGKSDEGKNIHYSEETLRKAGVKRLFSVE